ncbi:hypothetical protein Esi_0004_0268 [Ectocarpus siliculosus]|uniref:Uncharacterized protein n=1 Tax=Ectocarpus siliculosus TaxID=2880 RepID=D8LMK3_ECTSI|nr:hypothetical protein Esi_0004_0268 [Ectocarpus siliculosus]|eukprot:CBN77613.1 hypothetical protein Esi_0004_0268 [Ectocarpus siliculosus]
MQREMMKAEQAILGRFTDALASYTGYGGAMKNLQGDKLWYNNMLGIGAYGEAGAGETVPS